MGHQRAGRPGGGFRNGCKVFDGLPLEGDSLEPGRAGVHQQPEVGVVALATGEGRKGPALKRTIAAVRVGADGRHGDHS